MGIHSSKVSTIHKDIYNIYIYKDIYIYIYRYSVLNAFTPKHKQIKAHILTYKGIHTKTDAHVRELAHEVT